MTRWFFVCLLAWVGSAHAADSYFETYPTGHVSLDAVYDAIATKRQDLRLCHHAYLQKIPGAFDELSVTFEIDPNAKAVFFENKSTSLAKQEAITCLKTHLARVSYPRPRMGVVFVKFVSDQNMLQKPTNQALSRNAVMLIPFVPQKMIRSMFEMYMPFYKDCFVRAPKKKRPMRVSLSFRISTQGTPENILVKASPFDENVTACMMTVTQEHRYPSGYAQTEVGRTFDIK